MESLTKEERARFDRQIRLPNMGDGGQLKLKQAKVLIVGVGGLGCPASLYLAAAGIGTLGLSEDDVVDASNLHRQILYGTADVGRPKIECATEKLTALSSSLKVHAHPRITENNGDSVIAGYDLVIDGTDNLKTRYLLNDACAGRGLPLLLGSVLKFSGQVALFDSTRGACYRCLYPEAPPREVTPACGEAGVLGVVPGTIGLLQATEAIKFLLGDRSGVGRLLVWNAEGATLKSFKVTKQENCLGCSNVPTRGEEVMTETVPLEMSPTDLKKTLDRGEAIQLLDVREPEEFKIANIGGLLIPMGDLEARYIELDPNKTTVTLCHHGVRSRHAAAFLRSLGFPKVTNLAGGIERWSTEVDPKVARY